MNELLFVRKRTTVGSLFLLLMMLFSVTLAVAESGDYFSRADSLYIQNDFSSLEKLSREELSREPESLDALYFLIAVNIKKDEVEKASPFIEKFSRLQKESELLESKEVSAPVMLMDTRHVGLYMYLGEQEFKKENFDEAIYWLTRAKGSYFKDLMLNFFLGISYKELGQYDKALKYLNRQLEFHPDEPSPLYNIACVYSQLGDADKAIHWLSKAISINIEFATQAKSDKDFDKIRSSKAFSKLIGS